MARPKVPILLQILMLLLFAGNAFYAHAAPQTTPAAITLYGDSAYKSLSHMPFANPNAPKGGSISYNRIGSFDSLNALINKGMPVDGTNLLSDTLTVGSPDEPFARYPLLAERVTRDLSDPSYIIYHLNPKAKFSNGRSVLADDVVFTFETILKEGAPGIQMYFSDVAKVTAVSERSVKFTFARPDNYEIGLIVGEVPILSRADWQSRSGQNAFNRVNLTPAVGSGPYVVESINPGKAIHYKLRSDYWARDLPINKGRFNFGKQSFIYYLNEEVAFEGFKIGQYTFREENKAKRWAKNYQFNAIKQGSVIKTLEPHNNPVPMQAIILNLRRQQFSDIKVRQALTLAFDFEWMNKALFNSSYQRLHSFFHNSELAATGKPSEAEMKLLRPLLPMIDTAMQPHILRPWQSPTSDGSGFNRANLLKARTLLLAAGYRYKGTMLVDSKGKPLAIEALIANESLERVMLPWIKSLRKLGIDATIRVADKPQYVERLRQFDYDVIVDGFAQSLSPGNEQFGYWGSVSANEPGSRNYAGISSKAIDSLLNQLVTTKERKDIVLITHALDRVLRAGFYMVPMYGLNGDRLAYWNYFAKPAVKPKYTNGVDYWWYDSRKAKQTAAIHTSGSQSR